MLKKFLRNKDKKDTMALFIVNYITQIWEGNYEQE